jgi:predicted metal-dependent phosphoesterase TrpH
MLKVELHTHTADDPVDAIPYTTHQLIDHAVALGYDALAVTLHDRQMDLRHVTPYARERGLVLIPGVERTVDRRHVLLLNYSSGADDVRSFGDLARLKKRARGLVVAPHAYFPGSSCLRKDLERHADLFDAVERNAMFVRGLDFNRPAERFALRHGKPIVGNCDVHRLMQLGSTYSLIDAERDPDAICEAIREGRVRVESQPVSWTTASRVIGSLMLTGTLRNGLERKPGRIDIDDDGVLEM